MDDHDQWNPDMDETKTKITGLKSVLETGSRQHSLMYNEATVYPGLAAKRLSRILFALLTMG